MLDTYVVTPGQVTQGQTIFDQLRRAIGSTHMLLRVKQFDCRYFFS